ESKLSWRFCQRVRGIKPNIVAKGIDLSLALVPEDTTHKGILPGGTKKWFVVFVAGKREKTNAERVAMNRFLPADVQCASLHIDTQACAGFVYLPISTRCSLDPTIR